MIDTSALFPGAAETTYLNTASMALGNAPAALALETAAAEWRAGTFDWVAAEGVGEELRAMVATLIRVDVDDIAFVTGASGGASTVAAQLPTVSGGANVVVPARDFTSNFVPWTLLAERGYQIRLVEDVDGALPAEKFSEAIDRETAIIATSVVQSATGYRTDLDALKTLAADAGAWLVVDASQALGAVDIDPDGITALFSCSHKWTLGIRGTGYLYVKPDLGDAFRPITPGWKSVARPMQTFYGPDIELTDTAAKLDASWGWFNPLADIEGMRIVLDAGIGAIERHNMSLVDALESAGIVLPFSRHERSQIVSISLAYPDAALEALAREKIVASGRAGNLRISVHLYNTLDDIDRLLRSIR